MHNLTTKTILQYIVYQIRRNNRAFFNFALLNQNFLSLSPLNTYKYIYSKYYGFCVWLKENFCPTRNSIQQATEQTSIQHQVANFKYQLKLICFLYYAEQVIPIPIITNYIIRFAELARLCVACVWVFTIVIFVRSCTFDRLINLVCFIKTGV